MAEWDRYEPGSVELGYTHSEACEELVCFDVHDEGCAPMNNEGWHVTTPLCQPAPIAMLPHQCERWCIGDSASVDQLIADLRELQQRMK